jgi:hypothetical protein
MEFVGPDFASGVFVSLAFARMAHTRAAQVPAAMKRPLSQSVYGMAS